MKKAICLMLCVCMAAVSAICFTGCRAFNLDQWQRVYTNYVDHPERFRTLQLKITELREPYEENVYLSVEIDREDFMEKYGDEQFADSEVQYYDSLGFMIISESTEILQESGFFEEFSNDTIYTVLTFNYIGWDGWSYPILGIETEEKIYLDTERGTQNWENYILDFIESYQ